MIRGYLRTFLLALMIILSGAGALLMGSDDAGGKITITPPYHNATLKLNVTLANGTPAAGFRASWYNDYSSGSVSGTLDTNGIYELSLPFANLGHGRLIISNKTNHPVHKERMHAHLDEVIWKNISLPAPSTPYNTVTGVLREGDGMAIGGEKVMLYTFDDFGNQIYHENITDQNGNFHFLVQNITTYHIGLSTPSHPDRWGAYYYFFMQEDVHHYEIDMLAYEKYTGDITSRVRYINTETGEPIPGSVSITPFSADYYFRSFEDNVEAPDPDGWFNFTAAKGEVNFYFSPNPQLYPNINLYTSQYFIHNDTSESIEFQVDPDMFVPVEVHITNASGDIENANCFYWLRGVTDLGGYNAEYNNGTDENGTLIMHFPGNMVRNVQISASGHSHTLAEVDTTGPGPYSIDVVLEESAPFVPLPETTANITVIDDMTGIPVQGARINGLIYSDSSSYSISGYTNATGVWAGTVKVGTYSYISASLNLGHTSVEDVTFVEAGPNNIEIKLERREPVVEDPGKGYHFYAVDLSGEPVPDAEFWINGQFHSRSSYGVMLTSDENGRVDLMAVPGKEVTIKMDQFRNDRQWNPYAIQTQKFTVASGEYRLPDVTLYPRWTPHTITGFIRDCATLEPMRYQSVQAHSVLEPKEAPTRMMMLDDYMDGVDFMTLYRHANDDGFFRTYGLETVILEVHQEGYFTYKEEVRTAPVRADIVYDIMMDPLPDTKVWLNGTLVDENEDPIPGELNITDFDHPAMNGHDLVINETGRFSIELYPSNYTLFFFNETLSGSKLHDLGDEGSDAVVLQLIPLSTIAGQVVDREGVPVEGINVTLEDAGNTELISWMITDEGGNFSFEVPAGSYDILIPMSELYDKYMVNDISVNGWDDWWNRLYLNNRTLGTLIGTVTGSGGFYSEGIPGVTVTLLKDDEEVLSTVTDGSGRYEIGLVTYGTYDLNITPPSNLQPVFGLRSGYVPRDISGIAIYAPEVTSDVELEYVIHTPPGYVNVTYNTPNGTDEFLDTPVNIVFSEMMDKEAVEGSITITPPVTGLEFVWSDWGDWVTIYHDDFLPNTTYTVEIGLGAVSYDGWPLWGEQVFSWTFSTGIDLDPWTITSADVALVEMNLTVLVEAPPDLTIYICIVNVGYLMLEEGPNGTYTLMVGKETLGYDTIYHYFFTNIEFGDDRAPIFGGTFTTPEAPIVPVVWSITSAEVTVLATGDWMVEVEGNPGMTIYIVIEKVGSFLLQETGAGFYQCNVYYTNFEIGETYSYYFSDEENGTDLAPIYSGSITDPRSESEDDGNRWCLVCCLLSVVAALVLVLVVFIIRRKKKDDMMDEE